MLPHCSKCRSKQTDCSSGSDVFCNSDANSGSTADERIQSTNANQTHYDVGKKVRQTIEDLGGTMPEDLPTAESIKSIEIKHKNKLKDKD